MAQVNVTINGRQFRMACEDGQEGHLRQLAKDLDERIVALRGQFGEIGDARLTVMAALTVADELAETGKKLQRLEEELAALQDARGAAAERNEATQAAIVAAFTSAAERIEGMAKKLSQSGAASSGSVARDSSRVAGMAGSGGRFRTTLAGRGCGVRQRHIPRGLTILKGAVPGRAPGSGHMAPTYLCRFPGSRSDGHAAPHFLASVGEWTSARLMTTPSDRRPQNRACARPRSRGATRCPPPSGRPRPRRSRRGRFRSRSRPASSSRASRRSRPRSIRCR